MLSAPVPLLVSINANTYTTRCVCRDTQFAGAVVYRINAMHAAGRGGRVNRQVSASGFVIRTDANRTVTTLRITRCCDAQCAFAVVFASMPSVAPVVLAALIVREVPAEELYAKMPSPEVPVVVPVVVMLSAPEPLFQL